VVNTTQGRRPWRIHSPYAARPDANIAYYTTVAGAKAVVDSIVALKEKETTVKPLQEY
jgi:carbamoyl-phosphate synthase large subunit